MEIFIKFDGAHISLYVSCSFLMPLAAQEDWPQLSVGDAIKDKPLTIFSWAHTWTPSGYT